MSLRASGAGRPPGAALALRLVAAALTAVVGAGTASGDDAPADGAPEPPEGMVWVPAGATWIGDDEGDPDEAPARRVEVPGFFIDRTEVTNDAYAAFVADTGRAAPGDGAEWAAPWAWTDGAPRPGTGGDPVFLVTWEDADAYCRWVGRRLPTELEWERAARGDDRRRWAWGDDWDPRETRANWFDGEDHPDGHAHVAPADSHPEGASPCGALNMTGNVWEWVADAYREDRFGDGAPPAGPDGRPYRVVRGGSWYTNNWYWMRVSFRYFLPADEVSTIYGFRCAADAPRGAVSGER